MRTLGDIREYAAEHFHLSGIPTEMIDVWIRHGHRKIQNATTWPWHQTVQTYDVSASADATEFSAIPGLRRVLGVTDPEFGELRELQFQTAAERFFTGRSIGGRIAYYTVLAELESGSPAGVRLRLWPAQPGASPRTGVLVSGLKVIDDWPGDATTESDYPPLPEPFHELLEMWTLNEMYLREQQPQMAAPQYAAFNTELDNLKDQYVNPGSGQFTLAGGDGRSIQASLAGSRL